MRRKQVNMQYVPTRIDPDPVIQRPSITDSLQEISHFLATETTTNTLTDTSVNDHPCNQQDADEANSALEEKTDEVSGTEKKAETQQIVKEMLDWKHKYHALENESKKQAVQAEENVKRLQEGFLLELTASVEVHKAKIEEISEELQRLVSENEAFRNQLSYHNIEPATIPIDTPGFREYGATAEEMKYIKDAHQYAISSASETTEHTENLKSNIENTIQVVEYELNLLKVGYLVPRDELIHLAKDHHERSAGQVAKDTLMKAIPGLFARKGHDRRKHKTMSRSDSIDSASIRSVDTTYTTSSRTTVDTRISQRDSRRNTLEYDENARIPKSATTNSGLRALLTQNYSNIDRGLDDDESIKDTDDVMPVSPSSSISLSQPPYVLRSGAEAPNVKQGGLGWTKRKRVVVPTDALPPSISASQSCPSHLHR
ncbi:hypothetical protein BC943DRAFT_381361 [Umbelopsis sp. AD052]|nr:hypothetical protein BC943DRAFT_381361 [Umbelopsis sp. AD052]